MSATLYLDHETIFAQQFNKGITSGHASCLFKQLLDNDIKFRTAKSGIVLAIFLSLLHNQRLDGILGKFGVILMVIK